MTYHDVRHAFKLAFLMAYLLSSISGDEIVTGGLSPAKPFQALPYTSSNCENRLLSPPHTPDVLEQGHRLCEATPSPSSASFRVVSAATVNKGKLLQMVTMQNIQSEIPLRTQKYFNYALQIQPFYNLECHWSNGKISEAAVYIQAQEMVVIHQCELLTDDPSSVRIRSRDDETTQSLQLCPVTSGIYDMTVCAGPIFGNTTKSEAVVEWIEENSQEWGQGRFVLYDRDGSLSQMPQLEWYRLNNYLEVIPWPSLVPVLPEAGEPENDMWLHREYFDQVLLYNHCLNRYRSTSVWILNLDLDEIVFSTRKNSSARFVNSNFGPFVRKTTLASYLKSKADIGSAFQINTIAYTFSEGSIDKKRILEKHILRQRHAIRRPQWHRPKTVFQPRFANFAWIHDISYTKRDACSSSRIIRENFIHIKHFVDLRAKTLDQRRCDSIDPKQKCDTPGEAGDALPRLPPSALGDKFVSYIETEGLNNQRIALVNGFRVADALKRTLIVPDRIHFHLNDSVMATIPTPTCSIWDCDKFPTKWVFRSAFNLDFYTSFNISKITCVTVQECEKLLKKKRIGATLLDIPVDKVMMQMSQQSETFLLVKKSKIEDLAISQNLLNIAHKASAHLGDYDALHHRTGDTFLELYPGQTFQKSHGSFLKSIPEGRALYFMTDDNESPYLKQPNVKSYRGQRWSKKLSKEEIAVVEQIIASEAVRFSPTLMSTMSQFVMYLRVKRPGWTQSKLPSDADFTCVPGWCQHSK